MSYYTGAKGLEYYKMRHQRRSDFVQQRRASHFQAYINPDDIVLDFGCGTGGVLSHIQCAQKIGIEVNAPSIAEAKEKNITIFSDLKEVKDQSVNVVISNHAIEHVDHPLAVIKDFHRILKKGGMAVLVVPSENPDDSRFIKWNQNDPDHHFYSWTPLSFGNLIHSAGFDIKKSFRRPIGYSKANNFLFGINKFFFELSRHVVAYFLKRYEIVCIAVKK